MDSYESLIKSESRKDTHMTSAGKDVLVFSKKAVGQRYKQSESVLHQINQLSSDQDLNMPRHMLMQSVDTYKRDVSNQAGFSPKMVETLNSQTNSIF